MTQNNLHKNPASPHALLLTLVYGPTTTRLARWTNNIVLGANTFISEPTIEVDLGLQHSGTDEKSHTLRISRNIQPFINLVKGYQHARVEVTVEELNPLDVTTRRKVAFGWIGNIIRSPGGKGSLCRCTILTVKSLLQDVRVSIPVLSSCDLEFAGSICGAPTLDFEHSGTVASIGTPERNIVTLTLPTVSDPASELPDARYRRGRVTVDGMSIMVTQSLANRSFRLSSLPPPWWVGRPADLFPGCGKQLADCRSWNRESQFRGLGIVVPDRNVTIQASP